jgi:hypothetical protein
MTILGIMIAGLAMHIYACPYMAKFELMKQICFCEVIVKLLIIPYLGYAYMRILCAPIYSHPSQVHVNEAHLLLF